MHPLCDIGFLQYAKNTQLGCVGDSVYLIPPRRRNAQGRFIGSFRNFVQAFASEAAKSVALYGEINHFSIACKIASSLSELRFCLTDLIDGLAELEMPRTKPKRCRTDVEQRLGRLTENAAALQHCAPGKIIESSIVREFCSQISPPCAIGFEEVIPLKEVSTIAAREDCVLLEDKHYAQETSQSKHLDDVCQIIQEQGMSDGNLMDTYRGSVLGITKSVIADMRGLLELYPSSESGAYRLLYSDSYHQLQCNNRGDCVLIRGPLRYGYRNEELFLGLPIMGEYRRQLLSVSPIVIKHPSQLWNANGQFSGQALCMGNNRQYSHLLTKKFTDAEAVFQWLEAGVIVATRRSDLHAKWRKDPGGHQQARRIAPTRGGRRHV
jgi:hypothetical protein